MGLGQRNQHKLFAGIAKPLVAFADFFKLLVGRRLYCREILRFVGFYEHCERVHVGVRQIVAKPRFVDYSEHRIPQPCVFGVDVAVDGTHNPCFRFVDAFAQWRSVAEIFLGETFRYHHLVGIEAFFVAHHDVEIVEVGKIRSAHHKRPGAEMLVDVECLLIAVAEDIGVAFHMRLPANQLHYREAH